MQLGDSSVRSWCMTFFRKIPSLCLYKCFLSILALHRLRARRSIIIINQSHFHSVSLEYFFSSTLASSSLPRSFISPPISSSNTFKSDRHPLFLFSAAPTFLHLFHSLIQIPSIPLRRAIPSRYSLPAFRFCTGLSSLPSIPPPNLFPLVTATQETLRIPFFQALPLHQHNFKNLGEQTVTGLSPGIKCHLMRR